MKLSYKWLREFIDAGLSPQEAAELITFSGIETTLPAAGDQAWANVITAKVVEKSKHPQADKLSLCSLTDGNRSYAVVCGAPNVEVGQVVPLALAGAELPGGLKIKKAKIRGAESEGMICSQKELGLSEESSGIMVLDPSTALGKQLKEALGSDDTVLEIEIPTNRPDALSHWGVAREIAAKTGRKLNMPEFYNGRISSSWDKITIADPELCSRYIGIKITGVKVGPSPAWLSERLKICGLRPINNIVDITNYVLLELGHPLHAFDLAKLEGGEIVVRKSLKDEKITALDGKEYKLDGEMLVIADKKKAQAIAGVMGAEGSGVTLSTREVILESAVFKPQSIRKASKKLGLSTDASYRFERGAGWTVAETAALRALKLICDIAGGKPEAIRDAAEKPFAPVRIELRPERLKRISGMHIPSSDIAAVLSGLGMKVAGDKTNITAEVPSWRIDITQEIDLIEEVLRIKGYDAVPVTLMPVVPDGTKRRDLKSIEQLLAERFLPLGFSEAVNGSFAEEKELAGLKLPAGMRIANPLSRENEVMRPSLLPGLWKNILLNLRQGYTDIGLYETGAVFTAKGEKRKFGVAACGAVWPEWWRWEGKFKETQYDYYYFSGVLKAVLAGNRVVLKENTECSAYFHPGKSALIELNGKVVGETGMLHPDLTAEAAKDICYAELDLEALNLVWNRKKPSYKPISRRPPVKRDLSVIAKKSVPFDSIWKIIEQNAVSGGYIANCQLFSKYEDEKIGAANISYSFHLTFRHPELTLTDIDVNARFEQIVAALNKELGITLR